MTSDTFKWKPEHQVLLEKIASSDTVEDEWSVIRDAVKHKINENIKFFLGTARPTYRPPYFNPIATPTGGVKFAPFPPHKPRRVHLNEKPPSFMQLEEAQEAKKYIFEQLDSFDSVPFSIQRLCELCVNPRAHYNCVGKYLRAVERSTLVTSTHDAFPPLTEREKDSFGRGATLLGPVRQSAPATPLFSPLSFSHRDARQSHPVSPTPSPLTLAAVGSIHDVHMESLETRALGLVDEMDDPGPGHLSDRPQAISGVTGLNREYHHKGAINHGVTISVPSSISSSPPQPSVGHVSTPIIGSSTAHLLFGGSLEQRFVRSGLMGPASDLTMVDENKENNQSK